MPPDDQPSPRRRALLVATARYDDPALAALRAPTGDVAALAAVLGDADIGGFEVQELIDRPTEELRKDIETFFDEGRPHDLLLLYVSGHGVLSQSRRFYFATATTSMQLLRSTAIEDSFVNDVMQGSRARSIVLVLDCCHSGAFGKGLAPKSATTVDVEHRFEGQGRVTLSASTELEYAFEETAVSELDPAAPGSLFTRSLVEGLSSGDADLDEDGRISVDDLYDYVCRRVRERSVHQTPGMAGDIRGEITIARSRRGGRLPPELAAAAGSNLAGIREGAVGELAALAAGTGGVATAARAALERLAEDDSRRVSTAAEAALGHVAPAAPARDVPPPAAPPPAPPPRDAPPPEPPPSSRRRALLIGAAVVAGLAALAVAAILLSGSGSPPPATAAEPYDFQKDDTADPVLALPKGAGFGSDSTAGVVLIGAMSDPQPFTPINAGLPDAQPDDRFGAAVASGDFDKNGEADLAIGVPGRDGVSVLYGAEYKPKWIPANALSAKPELHDFGAALVAADFDHDGYADLAVSAPGNPKQRERWDWATIHILFGGPGGLQTTGDNVIKQGAVAKPNHIKEFGYVMAAADVDRDGNVDLLEGGPGNAGGGNGGHLSFCRGSSAGPESCEVDVDSPTAALAVGHVDADPFPDVVQGDPGFDSRTGEVRVWSGGKGWLSQKPTVITQDTEGVRGIESTGNEFGHDVAVGEVTGARPDDIVVATPFDEERGSVQVIPGGPQGPVPTRSDEVQLPAFPDGGHFGDAISLLDYDDDDLPELIVGIGGVDKLDEAIVGYRSHEDGIDKDHPEAAVGVDKQARLNTASPLVLGR
jgi:hypothetical protein